MSISKVKYQGTSPLISWLIRAHS